jgi:DNA-binding SARP family transcriptional activator
MASLQMNLLGSFKAYLDGEPVEEIRSSRFQALLIYLAVEHTRLHRREALCTLLWSGMPEKKARHNLSQTLYALRQAFPDISDTSVKESVPLLQADRQTIQINPAVSIQVDIHTLDDLLETVQVHNHLNLGSCHDCIQKLEQAVALYQVDFLSNFYLEDSAQFQDWTIAVREAY